MKRFFSLVLIFSLFCTLLLFAPMACAEEDEGENSFDATLTNVIDRQASEWMESVEIRATLSMLLNFDLYYAKGEDASLTMGILNPSYVGRDGINLVAYYHLEENDLIIFYCPTLKQAYYSIQEKAPDIVVAAALEKSCRDGYYKNDPEDVLAALKAIQSSLSN